MNVIKHKKIVYIWIIILKYVDLLFACLTYIEICYYYFISISFI